jgi:hypothetical protein
MKFEHEAPDCTWMVDQLMKRSSGFKFVSLSMYFKNLI